MTPFFSAITIETSFISIIFFIFTRFECTMFTVCIIIVAVVIIIILVGTYSYFLYYLSHAKFYPSGCLHPAFIVLGTTATKLGLCRRKFPLSYILRAWKLSWLDWVMLDLAELFWNFGCNSVLFLGFWLQQFDSAKAILDLADATWMKDDRTSLVVLVGRCQLVWCG